MLFENLSQKEQELVNLYKYDVFREKCVKLYRNGVDNCLDDDDFNLKGCKITDDARDLIDLAVPQIIDYKGLIFDRPLKGLGISGFYYFMFLFYFERKRQLANRFEGYTIDSMLMRNSETGIEMWLMNLVDEVPINVIEKYMDK